MAERHCRLRLHQADGGWRRRRRGRRPSSMAARQRPPRSCTSRSKRSTTEAFHVRSLRRRTISVVEVPGLRQPVASARRLRHRADRPRRPRSAAAPPRAWAAGARRCATVAPGRCRRPNTTGMARSRTADHRAVETDAPARRSSSAASARRQFVQRLVLARLAGRRAPTW